VIARGDDGLQVPPPGSVTGPAVPQNGGQLPGPPKPDRLGEEWTVGGLVRKFRKLTKHITRKIHGGPSRAR